MSASSSTNKGKQPAHAPASSSHTHAHASPPPPACGSDCSHSHTAEDDDIPWPVVTSEDIDSALERREHFLDPNKGRTTACLSEMAGMWSAGFGIHKVDLEPHTESTVLHTHLAESEWIYILEGEVTLLLARSHGVLEDVRPVPEGRVEYSEVVMRKGDFAGFPAGNPNERYAHALRAGEERVSYLLGGDRKEVDVVTYPTLGKTLVCHEPTDGEAMFSARSGE